MKHDNVTSAISQMSSEGLSEAMHEFIRHQARHAITSIMEEEVANLCGAKHRQGVEERKYQRGGRAKGYVVIEGRKEKVNRPRVRKKSGNGTQEEVLNTYKGMQDKSMCFADFIAASVNGVSTRNISKIYPDSPNTSKSEISRLLQKHGAERLREFRQRDISNIEVVALMLDGICLSKDLMAIAALAIDSTGRKHFLDFEIGASEDYVNAYALTSRLVERGINVLPKRLLGLLDGSAALSKAMKLSFPGVVIQRCLVHKERNIRAKISKKFAGQLAAHFKELRFCRSSKEAESVVADLRKFLEKRSEQAVSSLDEAGDELTNFFKLGAAPALYTTLLSTNCIENSFNNVRKKLGRVTRWRPETEQGSFWMAISMTEAQKTFHRIKGHVHMQSLIEGLNNYPEK